MCEVAEAGADDDGGGGPGAVVDRLEIRAGLAELPPREREVSILVHVADLSRAACADVLDMPTAPSRAASPARVA
ncbi:sigma-70 family RNA polymerase sigma factor [Streptomyces hainanensis]|uniref:Sigma-70 family RNA polymerase sigma factor n=1 Tax=Streptomyces hainanensis TaxID=402648 RepID=A0A4R4TP94_9ACTN|nr:sigma-70 family RNA polymerase sigma factor [Streptomyces hainanensis]TDC75919.1 sigma-70 family RNA polymerase sigma factor [Streptomyces hainanensis]